MFSNFYARLKLRRQLVILFRTAVKYRAQRDFMALGDCLDEIRNVAEVGLASRAVKMHRKTAFCVSDIMHAARDAMAQAGIYADTTDAAMATLAEAVYR